MLGVRLECPELAVANEDGWVGRLAVRQLEQVRGTSSERSAARFVTQSCQASCPVAAARTGWGENPSQRFPPHPFQGLAWGEPSRPLTFV